MAFSSPPACHRDDLGLAPRDAYQDLPALVTGGQGVYRRGVPTQRRARVGTVTEAAWGPEWE